MLCDQRLLTQALWAPAPLGQLWKQMPSSSWGRWALGRQVWGPWGGRREELEDTSGLPRRGGRPQLQLLEAALTAPPALSPLAPGHPHTGTEIASF